MGIPDAALDEYEVQMNKWDDTLKDVMLSAEKKCRTFKNVNIEWSPTIKMWLGRRWLDFRSSQSKRKLGAYVGTKFSK